MSKLYDENSIESLSPLEFTRLRPQVYAGDTSYSTQLLVEILANSVDEHRLGHGSKITIKKNKDVISLKDDGQGFLVNSIREDGKTILEAAFSVLNTSGKYREDGVYEGTSLGSYGIGSKITNFLSSRLVVTSWRDGKSETVTFKEGEFESRNVQEELTGKSGTLVEWKPSKEFFTNTEIEVPKVKSLLKSISCLCPGLEIEFDNDGQVEVYKSKKGIEDLVDEKVNGKEVINKRFILKFEDGKYKIDLVMTYTSDYSLTLIPYVNAGLTERGPHIAQIKTVITREFNKFFRDKGWIKEKDANLTGDDIQEGMYLMFNVVAPDVRYDAQVKSTVTKIDISVLAAALSDELQSWLTFNEKEVKAIADKALNARKARDAARKAKDAVRGIANKNEKKKALKFDSKLADAGEKKNRLDCELFIVEGK